MRRRPRPRSLGISDDSEAKLASRGMSLDDAEFALKHRPAWTWQRSKKRPGDEGSGERPGRWVMTGRGLQNDFVTFVLEAPDRDGLSRVVTGWLATEEEWKRYNRQS